MSKKKDAPKSGAPTKYREEYCQQLIDHMSEGYTFESFAGKVSVCKDTLNEWASVHEAFSAAKRHARSKQLEANEKTMHQIAKGKLRGANVTAQIFIMKNCHKWTDRLETTERKPGDKTDEELIRDTEKLLNAAKEAAGGNK